MDIYIGFNENKKKSNIKGTIYNFSNYYSEEGKSIEIFSSKNLSQKEINSLGKIYFYEKELLKKGYIDLIIDRYIINII